MPQPQRPWRWLALAGLAFAIGASSASADTHPGWSRDAIVSAATRLLGATDLKVQKVAQAPANLFLIDPTEKASCFSGPGEEIVSFQTGTFGTALLFGTPQHVHTVFMYFPIVNVPSAEQEKAMAFYQGLFKALFPDWTGSAAWPRDSFAASWRAAGKADSDPTVPVNDTIARTEVAGARLATSGVPPDLIDYRITARGQCELISPYLLASPRLPRPGQTNPRGEANVILNQIRPQPADFTDTPYFLGEVGASACSDLFPDCLKFGSRELKLSNPDPAYRGYLPEGAIQPGDWPQRQDFNGTPLAAFVASRIRSEFNITALITDPRMPFEFGGHRYMLVVNHALVDAAILPGGAIKFHPAELSGLLFADFSPPPPPPAPPTHFGTDITLGGTAAPVDLTATPLFVSIATSGGIPPDRPDIIRIKIAGDTATITDTTGATATIDLRAWYQRQPPLPPPLRDGTHPEGLITNPRIDFTLNGKRAALVVTYAALAHDADAAPSAVSGSIFRER